MAKNTYNVSFRCFFSDEMGRHYTNHYQNDFPLDDIPKWLDAYHFTHPNVESVSVKVWFVNRLDDTEE